MFWFQLRVLVTPRTIRGFQVLVPGVEHQLCKQVLGSVAEVKGPEHPAETDLICIAGFRYSNS